MQQSKPVNRVFLHVRNFKKALEQYDGTQPLAKFLQGFFRENKQMGSKDRKMTSRFLYHYFRLGRALADLELEKRLAVADFLCAPESDLFMGVFPEWAEEVTSFHDLDQKIEFVSQKLNFHTLDVFPFIDQISQAIPREDFCKGFLQQASVFIRVRTGKMHAVQLLLREAGILYQQKDEYCLELPVNTPLDKIPKLKGLMEVQDFSSQKTLDGIEASPGEDWWDACSGAGGKSLLFLDRYPKVNMMVSDVRPSILKNLDERFEQAGIRDYRRKILDLTGDGHEILGNTRFDGIILDVPCSGSGTWSRTPEMMGSFDLSKLAEFQLLQKQILRNALNYLKPGKVLIYITCSVFEAENEAVIQDILEHEGVSMIHSRYLNGYPMKSDSMFVAHLQKL